MYEPTIEGYIQRLVGSFSGWQTEYAEVKSGEFRYYKPGGRKLSGIVPLRDARIEMVASDPLRVTIKIGDGKTIQLKCKDVTNKVEWVNALCMGNSDIENSEKKELLDSTITKDLREVRSEIADLFQTKMLTNSSKLDAFLTQVWTLQGLLEATLSDFTGDVERLKPVPESLKENAESIRRYTTELKVTQPKT